MSEFKDFEEYLSLLSIPELREELRRWEEVEREYRSSGASAGAALFFGHLSRRSGNFWKINAIQRELAQREIE